MFAKCNNCGRQVLAEFRDKSGVFCSTECRDYVAYPGFCQACIDSSTPISAGHNITFNGIEGMFYGTSNRCETGGSVLRSQWLCLLFVPIFRVGRYRVKYVAPNRYLSREPPRIRKRNSLKTRHRMLTCPICGCLGFHREDCPAKARGRSNQA
jgi:hypothetical protein